MADKDEQNFNSDQPENEMPNFFEAFQRMFPQNDSSNGLPQELRESLEMLGEIFRPATTPLRPALMKKHALEIAPSSSLTLKTSDQAQEYLQIADLWLDSVTTLPPALAIRQAWTPARWVEVTTTAWEGLCSPIAENIFEQLSQIFKERFGEVDVPGEFQASTPFPIPGLSLENIKSQITPKQLIKNLGAAIFSKNLGKAIGELSKSVLGIADIAYPLVAPGAACGLVMENVEQLAEELDLPVKEVAQYLAVREVAHARLWDGVAWLPELLSARLNNYASCISIDQDALDKTIANIQEKMRENLPEDFLEQAQHGLAVPLNLNMDLGDLDNLFVISNPEAEAVVDFQAILALIEGWVDEISIQACIPHLPSTMRLQELMRRRQAINSPIEAALKPLIGWEFSPRLNRNAASIWSQLLHAKGIQERDKLWSHPDVIPSAEELSDPKSFLAKREAQQQDLIDSELNQILDGTLGWAEGLSPENDE